MFEIDCPHCGPRDMTEFTCHGEAHIARPKNSLKLSDEAWGDYVFFRSNPKGLHSERWMHAHGCRKWFNVRRHTMSDEIIAVYQMGERPPAGSPQKIVRDKKGRGDEK
ncbi:MAG: sarcosine oxidase subunit delta [Alphaproteobacteria bacterium]|nr:sarcosine oxidase subunit delta [Alphaproteobacteria bacterium]